LIRTLLAHGSVLVRGALAFVLGAEDDIEVVAEIGRLEDLAETARKHLPDVTVLDLDLLLPDDQPGLPVLHRDLPGRVLILAEVRRSRVLGPMMAGQPPGLGFLAKDVSPPRLLAAVREVARGEQVLDPELVVSALRAHSPLTPRETEVLRVAAEGVPVAEIAVRLALAPGTVRNHLSRVIAKVGARTRIEAVRLAHEAGWI
jgi:two-component system response regulator DesR